MQMGFEESDASGFDECLPSVSPCRIMMGQEIVEIPDHGDFWRLHWCSEKRGSGIHMRALGQILPLEFEKTLTLHGPQLEITYRITNKGQTHLPYLWAAHPLFAIDAGDRVLLPDSVTTFTVDSSEDGRFRVGSIHTWPSARTLDGVDIDLSKTGAIHDDTGDMIYTTTPPEGWVALERVRDGVRIEVRYSSEQIPYLGLWLCYGGWPQGGFSRQQAVSIEPSTSPGGSLAGAVANGEAFTLSPGATSAWEVQIHLSSAAQRNV